MAKHTIYHVLILDKSDSMRSVRDVTIQGFNENLKGMREDKVDGDITQVGCLVVFSDDVRESIWLEPVADLPDLAPEQYKPSGSTALFDAIGKTVTRLENEIGEEIKKKDANVVVTIFTDGQENASTEWKSPSKLRDLLAELRKSGQWTFTFIGCEEATLQTAQSIGFSAANTLKYEATVGGTDKAFKALRSARTNYNQKLSATVSTLKCQDFATYAVASSSLQDGFFDDVDKDEQAKSLPNIAEMVAKIQKGDKDSK